MSHDPRFLYTNHTPLWFTEQPLHSHPQLSSAHTTDLLIVGAGFTGLWTAIQAKLRNPERAVTLIERDHVGGQASGRNGGFIHASLTHGSLNGLASWPDEHDYLIQRGLENLNAIRKFVREHNIECEWQDVGELTVARTTHHARQLTSEYERLVHTEPHLQWWNQQRIQAEIHTSDLYAAIFDPMGVAMMQPYKLARGLAEVAKNLGVHIFERTSLKQVLKTGSRISVETNTYPITANKVAVCTNAFKSPARSVRSRIASVYDYQVVTRPLSASEWDSIGWNSRAGVVENSNLFHYYRRTGDGRIVFGGYDAVYHFNNAVGTDFEVNHESFRRLADHFSVLFPQLKNVTYDFAWGGAIDTSSRFTPFWHLSHAGHVGYVAGFTGLGTGSSRFAASVLLDLLDQIDSPDTRLSMVRHKPWPFPPEPFKSLAIVLTQKTLEREDQTQKTHWWLKLIRKLGLGFSS